MMISQTADQSDCSYSGRKPTATARYLYFGSSTSYPTYHIIKHAEQIHFLFYDFSWKNSFASDIGKLSHCVEWTSISFYLEKTKVFRFYSEL